MKLPNLRDRHFVNVTSAAAVLFHLVALMMASRFETLWMTQLAIVSGLALYFVFGPIFWFWHRTTKPARLRHEALSDVRQVFALAEQLLKYNPEQYFDFERGLFAGLEVPAEKPLYIPWPDYRKTHMQVLGTTGVGKGVATTMFLTQSLLSGECVVIFDPKDDEFAPNVFHRFAQQAGLPFYLIDLRPSAPPQLNLFRHCSQVEIEELLMVAFDMGDKGNPSDFYRLFDRAAARDVCLRAAVKGSHPTIQDLVIAANQSNKIDAEKGQKFKADLEELAGLAAIGTAAGHDLLQLLSENAVVYVVGSIRNIQSIRVQKMLLLRMLQIIEQRDRTKKLRYIAMMLDELKYLLSPAALQALGTVRDKSCHIMLAHQSNGDLEDCGGLDPNAVKGAVLVNTGLKLIYRATDPDTLKWASELSGSIVVKQQSAHIQQGMFHAAEGQFREMERPWITPNEILAMPKLCGMFFGAGLARRVHVDTLAPGQRPQITPAGETSPAVESHKGRTEIAAKTGEEGHSISQSLPNNREPVGDQNLATGPKSTSTNSDPLNNLY
jgi:hypothetical protein